MQRRNLTGTRTVKRVQSSKIQKPGIDKLQGILKQRLKQLKATAYKKSLLSKQVTIPADEFLKQYTSGKTCKEITVANQPNEHYHLRDYQRNLKWLNEYLRVNGESVLEQHEAARKKLKEQGKIVSNRGRGYEQVPLPNVSKLPFSPRAVLDLLRGGYYESEVSAAYKRSYGDVYRILQKLSEEERNELEREQHNTRLRVFGPKSVTVRQRLKPSQLTHDESQKILREAANVAAGRRNAEIIFAKPTLKGIRWAEKKAIQISSEIRRLEQDRGRISANLIARDINKNKIQDLERERKELTDYMGGWLPESEVPRVFKEYLEK